MTPAERAEEILADAHSLLESIEDGAGTLTIADARRLWSTITEARGWLLSALALLEPKENAAP